VFDVWDLFSPIDIMRGVTLSPTQPAQSQPAAVHPGLLSTIESFAGKFESGIGLATVEMPLAAMILRGVLQMFEALHPAPQHLP
jgi:hypothetical protein